MQCVAAAPAESLIRLSLGGVEEETNVYFPPRELTWLAIPVTPAFCFRNTIS
jgi:hypothetical protein